MKNSKEILGGVATATAAGSILSLFGFTAGRAIAGNRRDAVLTDLYHEAFSNRQTEPSKSELAVFGSDLKQYGWSRGEYDLAFSDGGVKPTGFAYSPSEDGFTAFEEASQLIDFTNAGIIISGIVILISGVSLHTLSKK